MNVYIASDHGGFKLKNKIVKNATYKPFEFIDLGPFTFDKTDDYPDFASKVAKAIQEDKGSRGILVCRSGNGMCIAANKFKGIYAALAFSKEHAKMAVKDDNANVLCLDADYPGEDPLEFVEPFLKADFAGMDTRHGRRHKKIKDIESKL